MLTHHPAAGHDLEQPTGNDVELDRHVAVRGGDRAQVVEELRQAREEVGVESCAELPQIAVGEAAEGAAGAHVVEDQAKVDEGWVKALLEPSMDVIRPELVGIDAARLERQRGGVGDEGLVEVEDDRENGGLAAHHGWGRPAVRLLAGLRAGRGVALSLAVGGDGGLVGRVEAELRADAIQLLRRGRRRAGGLERLIEQLRSNRGDLRLSPNDFKAWSRGARFYPLLYMLTRVCGTRDWGSGVALSSNLLGKGSQLHLHHILPKSLLYQHGYSRPAVNALGNFTFLTQEINLEVSNKPPAEYLPQYLEKHPGTIESHWIPTDPELWKIENYYTFLDRRRELLAEAANAFLDGLLAGSVPESAEAEPAELPKQAQPLGAVLDEDEEARLIDANTWVVAQALPEGDFMYEILADSGDVIACFDLAWPDGLQFGLSEPVALLLDEPPEVLQLANARGFRYFTDLESFREYVSREVLAGEGMPAVGVGAVAP